MNCNVEEMNARDEKFEIIFFKFSITMFQLVFKVSYSIKFGKIFPSLGS